MSNANHVSIVNHVSNANHASNPNHVSNLNHVSIANHVSISNQAYCLSHSSYAANLGNAASHNLKVIQNIQEISPIWVSFVLQHFIFGAKLS